MARAFHSATAESVITVVQSVVALKGKASVAQAAAFADVPEEMATSALELAQDLGLLRAKSGSFEVASPLCRFLATPSEIQKAAVMRVVLESYAPFLTFREQMPLTTSPTEAARQTRAILNLGAHQDNVRDTLLGLGMFSQAISSKGGGLYVLSDPLESPLEILAAAAANAAQAEGLVREQLGTTASAVVSREDVIVPLGDAFLHARAGDARTAVVLAGNAIESYLDEFANLGAVTVSGSPGINAKLDLLDQANALPKKLVHVGKYLGHVRNAADHGIDADIAASWVISGSTGLQYPFIACSFIFASYATIVDGSPEI